MTISASKATQIAAEYYQDVTTSRRELTVEEIELDEVEDVWWITIGIGDEAMGGIVMPGRTKKEYKIFKINAINGQVKSMKIRTI